MATDIDNQIGMGSYWGHDPNSKIYSTSRDDPNKHVWTYGNDIDQGRKDTVGYYDQSAALASHRNLPQNDQYGVADAMGSRAQGNLASDASDATGQMGYLNGLSGLAYGSRPSDAVNQQNQTFQQGLANQRTAAASSPGGALAQAQGLRSVSQGAAGLTAQNALQGQALQAQQKQQAQQQYLQGMSNYAAQGAGANSQAANLAGVYASNATEQASNQQRENALNQGNDIFYQGLGASTNQQAANAYEANQDVTEANRKNRLQANETKNGVISRGVGASAGAVGSILAMLSDERTKDKGWGVMGMDDPNLRIGEDDRGYLASNDVQQPSLASHFGSYGGHAKSPPKVQSQSQARKMTPEEMLAAADKEIASLKSATSRRMTEGPAVRYAAGGDASNGYNTQLTQGAEAAYRSKFGDNSDRDYDLRGAFASGLTDGAKTQRAPDGSAYFPDHLPDTYKKPNHETFSDESKYAPMAPHRAGHWDGDKFRPASGSYQDLVNPNLRKYQESPRVGVPLDNQGPEDDTFDYGDLDDEDLAYGSPSLQYGRGALAYGGRRG